MVEVLVAARDLPVGTIFARDELKHDTVVRSKKVPKDGSSAFITGRDDLVDRRLGRAVHADETLTQQDLVKGGDIILPEGYDMVSLRVSVGAAAGGFVGPGSRVNVLATTRLENKLVAFSLLVNVLVVAVDAHTTLGKDGVFPNLNTVSFAVTEKQALLLALAKSQGCGLELMLRNPSRSSEDDRRYDIDSVIKLLTRAKEKLVESKEEPKERPAPGVALPVEIAPPPRPVEIALIPPAGE
jgi:Flp pilus assembly protein CpaB